MPTHRAQAMLDIALSFAAIQRSQMVGSHHALTQLLHIGALQDAPEFGLAEQKSLD